MARRTVGQIFSPLFEIHVGHHRGRALLIACGDDLVEQVSGFRALDAFDAVEPEFVDYQEIRARVAAQACGQSFVGERCGQVGQQFGRGAVEDAVTMHAGLLPYRLDDVTFPDPAPADQDQVGAAPDEVARGQLFDLHAVEGFGIELPVESLQRLCPPQSALRECGAPPRVHGGH